MISEEGMATNTGKISDVMSWETPTNVKELRHFLGSAGYYRKCVKHFGTISKPLIDLLKKGALFIWMSAHDVAFRTVKVALS